METKQTVTEWANDHLGLTLSITKRLHEEQTPFQHIEIVETEQYGRLLILDGVFQTSVKDEWTYHEMIAHVPLMMHPHPERVLIIGGGDGGVAREVCRHECVKQVDLCDIDGRVIELSKEYFPTISKVLLDPPKKLHVHVGDGIAFAAAVKDFYDVIIIDCSDPIGPGEGLFTREFTKAPRRPLEKMGSSSSRLSLRSSSRRPSTMFLRRCVTYSPSYACIFHTCRSIRSACTPS